MIDLNVLAEVVNNVEFVDRETLIEYRNALEVALITENREFIVRIYEEALDIIQMEIHLPEREEEDSIEYEDYEDGTYFVICAIPYREERYSYVNRSMDDSWIYSSHW